MSWRHAPPVYSPVSLPSLGRGVRALLGSRRDTADLEAQLAKMFAAREVVLVDSGTSALTLALRHAVRSGGVVAMPGFVCIDVITAAQGAGVRVLLYDVDADTLTPDLESLRRTLQAGAHAVLLAPLFGLAHDVETIRRTTSEFGVPIIEDAAQSAGGTMDGARIGSFGDVSILSFGRGKGMTAGSGGALLLRGSSVGWARAARHQLMARGGGAPDVVALAAQWMLARPMLYGLPASLPMLRLGEMVYHGPTPARAMSAAACAMLPSALSLEPDDLRRRHERAGQLRRLLHAHRALRPVREIPGSAPGYLRFPVIDTSGSVAPEPRLGVLRSYPMTLDQHPMTRDVLARAPVALPGCTMLRDRLLTLPTHSRVGSAMAAELDAWLSEISP